MTSFQIFQRVFSNSGNVTARNILQWFKPISLFRHSHFVKNIIVKDRLSMKYEIM